MQGDRYEVPGGWLCPSPWLEIPTVWDHLWDCQSSSNVRDQKLLYLQCCCYIYIVVIIRNCGNLLQRERLPANLLSLKELHFCPISLMSLKQMDGQTINSPRTKFRGGVYRNHSVRLSVRLSVCLSVCPSVCLCKHTIFRNTFLSNYLSQPLEIWYASLSCSTVLQVPISGLLDLYFLFTDLVTFATFFVKTHNFS